MNMVNVNFTFSNEITRKGGVPTIVPNKLFIFVYVAVISVIKRPRG